jgi:hypothetical protein
LIAAVFSNSVTQDASAQSAQKETAVGAALIGTVSAIGVGVYVAIQSSHTVEGCVSDNPNGLLLHTGNGKLYLLLGATTNIKADTRIKVRGVKKKKIPELTDQPTFIVEKLNKVYGSCSVSAVNP